MCTVELKSGEMYRGQLVEAEDNWNVQVCLCCVITCEAFPAVRLMFVMLLRLCCFSMCAFEVGALRAWGEGVGCVRVLRPAGGSRGQVECPSGYCLVFWGVLHG